MLIITKLDNNLNCFVQLSTVLVILTRMMTFVRFVWQFLRKLNRQERVVEEVKMVLKPHYHKRDITKDQYKEILGKSVNKVTCLYHRNCCNHLL